MKRRHVTAPVAQQASRGTGESFAPCLRHDLPPRPRRARRPSCLAKLAWIFGALEKTR